MLWPAPELVSSPGMSLRFIVFLVPFHGLQNSICYLCSHQNCQNSLVLKLVWIGQTHYRTAHQQHLMWGIQPLRRGRNVWEVDTRKHWTSSQRNYVATVKPSHLPRKRQPNEIMDKLNAKERMIATWWIIPKKTLSDIKNSEIDVACSVNRRKAQKILKDGASY